MKVIDMTFEKVSKQFEDDKQVAYHSDSFSITILDRMTGFGFRDVETGYRDKEGFWLASGNFDIRNNPDLSLSEAIKLIKENANVCVGTKNKRYK